MKLSFEFLRDGIAKNQDVVTKSPVTPTTVPSGWNWDWLNNWMPSVIQEPFTGAWQRNMEVRVENVLTYYAVYACVTLIAQDIGKLGLHLVEEDGSVEKEVEVAAFSPLLRKPNHFQTRQQFIESWVVSKLVTGNAYILKERSDRNTVEAMYVLNPYTTKPMIADDASIWYQLATDKLSGVNETNVMVPAKEIIHDVYCPLSHPLCGVSPITANWLPAMQGLNIQRSSSKFFANGAKPSGVLTAPGTISETTAQRLKETWEANYSGSNIGKVAVLGDGLTYEAMMVNAQDAQLINQLKLTAENICTTFHVPPHKIGIGPMPTYNNIEALDQQYYSNCLQNLIEAIEALLDEGIGLTKTGLPYETEFDLDDLLRMDTATQIKTWGDAVTRGIMAPNEAREKLNLPPVQGGDTPYMQQQNYSLEALDRRDNPPVKVTQPAQAVPGQGAQLPKPEPQMALPPPKSNWDEDAVLKGFRDAAA